MPGSGRRSRLRRIAIASSALLHAFVLVVIISFPDRSADRHPNARPPVEIVFYPEPAPTAPVAVQSSRLEPPAVVEEPLPAPEPLARTVAEGSNPDTVRPMQVSHDAPPEPEPAEPESPTSEVRRSVFASAKPERLEPRTQDREVRPVTVGDRRAVTGIFTSRSEDGDLVVAPETREPRLGGFSTPAGAPGASDSRRDEARVVAASGFGQVTRDADRPADGAARAKGIERGAFADAIAIARPTSRRELPVPEPDIPVEITSKPRPAYTDEARRLGVQGEVVLDVTFGASGKLNIHRVVEGLGHGLDEAAVEAARRIDFKPARRDGRAVDFDATLRVVFRLA